MGEQEKTIKYRFFAAKELKQGAEGASVSSDTRRLCDASGHIIPTDRQPYCASKIDARQKNPDVLRLLGFFIPIFHSAILVDAKHCKHRVDGI